MAYVYFIRAGDEAVKVGITTKTPEERLRALQVGNHLELEIVGLIELSETPRMQQKYSYDDDKEHTVLENKVEARCRAERAAIEIETRIQELFREERIRGEWFVWSDEMRGFVAEYATLERPRSRQDRKSIAIGTIAEALDGE